jgi:hypothetical protein
MILKSNRSSSLVGRRLDVAGSRMFAESRVCRLTSQSSMGSENVITSPIVKVEDDFFADMEPVLTDVESEVVAEIEKSESGRPSVRL